MRVTESGRFELLGRDLNRASAARAIAREHLSTGRMVNRLSDAPELAIQADRLLSEDRSITVYTSAAENARAWLTTQDNALQGATNLLSRVRQLAISAVAAVSQQGMEAIAVELEGLRAELIVIANTTFDGRPVFGGFGAATVQETAGVVNFVGDGGAVQRRVSEQNVMQVNVSGSEVFGFDAADDVFATIADLITDVRANNTDGIANSGQTRIAAAADRFSQGLGTVGARGGQVNGVIEASLARLDNVKAYRSSIIDTDLAQVALELTLAETAYQSVLAATARLQLPTLIDYLR